MLDDATILAVGQRIEMRTADAVVRAHQEELLRTAYLLTGDQERASELTESACLTQLAALLRPDEDVDWRARLLRALSKSYLNAPHPEPAATARQRPVSGFERYAVDDERARLWAALELCDPPQRLAFVLRDFNQLDEETVVALTGWCVTELRERLGVARTRLRDAAGARPDQPASALLIGLSLGAPRLDLWARLAGPMAQNIERERRRQRLAAVLLGGLALILLVGIVWMAGGWPGGQGDRAANLPTPTSAPRPTAVPRPSPTPSAPPLSLPVGSVPDVQLIDYSYSTGTGTLQQWHSQTIFRDPATGLSHEVDNPYSYGFNLSPDGARFVGVEGVEPRGQVGTGQPLLVCRATETGEVIWERTIPASDSLIVYAERVIVAHRDPEGQAAPELVAYDLSNGGLLGSWPVEPPEPIDNWTEVPLRLFRTPDESRLIVAFEQLNALRDAGERVIVTYRMPDMTVESVATVTLTSEELQAPGFFSLWGAQPTPDGDALYQYVGWDRKPVVTFLDFESGALHEVELPLFTPENPTGLTAITTTSHDGRWLYAFSNAGEVAVVDLALERLERVFQLDTAGQQFPARDGLGGYWGSSVALFAPDGGRLYLLDVWSPQSNQLTPEATTVIWVVDVASWRISERWDVPGVGTSLLSNADGSRLYLTTAFPPDPPQAGTSWVHQLYEIDAVTGALGRIDEELHLREPNYGFSVTSLRQSYQRSYGVTPVSAGITPRDLEAVSTLPLLELSTGEEVVAAGQQVRLALRFLDPTTQQMLDEATPDVRFDPGASVMLTLSHADEPDIIVVPLKVVPALWEGALPLDINGTWSASVQVSYTDGTRWSASWPALVDVTPSYLGSDGERYAFRLSTTPAEPSVDEPALMRVVISNIEHGGPLPEGVEIEGGLPERVNVLLMGSGFKTVTLQPIGHGVYADEATFLWAGRWQVELSIDQPELEGLPTKVNAGVLDVGY